MSNYDKFPKTKVNNFRNTCVSGYDDIIKILKEKSIGDFILSVETYPGVDDFEVISELKKLNPEQIIETKDMFKNEETISNQLKHNLTNDPVFGKVYYGEINDFIDFDKLEKTIESVEHSKGLTIIYGFGAALVNEGDMLIYLDMARWEIQQRYRQGLSNYNCSNSYEDILLKYKRAFFIEWRIADKHKMKLFNKIDYFIDTNKKNKPKMITGEALRSTLKQLTTQPFRTVPYFDPGVWGGQWMKEVCDLDKNKINFAWSFDGVPEENSLYLDFGNDVVEIPAMDLVLYQPIPLLGENVYSRFGAEFPIRFDLLDTIEGQNLSLQVHPLTEYIKKEFGMSYTQDESYYILEAKEDAVVYLGFKENIDSKSMINDLQKSERGEIVFDADKYINKFSAKKHDHFLIPSGTCHASGSNSMVLEISATPYIFTFKLWDWGRLGLDNKPRPVHIKHGKEVIRWERTTSWVEKNLINNIYEIERNDDYIEEHTGLHQLEFIETRRYWIKSKVTIKTNETVNMLNLIEGHEAVIESPSGEFEPYVVHYAETFIIPASIRSYTIRNLDGNKKIGVIRAYVR